MAYEGSNAHSPTVEDSAEDPFEGGERDPSFQYLLRRASSELSTQGPMASSHRATQPSRSQRPELTVFTQYDEQWRPPASPYSYYTAAPVPHYTVAPVPPTFPPPVRGDPRRSNPSLEVEPVYAPSSVQLKNPPANSTYASRSVLGDGSVAATGMETAHEDDVVARSYATEAGRDSPRRSIDQSRGKERISKAGPYESDSNSYPAMAPSDREEIYGYGYGENEEDRSHPPESDRRPPGSSRHQRHRDGNPRTTASRLSDSYSTPREFSISPGPTSMGSYRNRKRSDRSFGQSAKGILRDATLGLAEDISTVAKDFLGFKKKESRRGSEQDWNRYEQERRIRYDYDDPQGLEPRLGDFTQGSSGDRTQRGPETRREREAREAREDWEDQERVDERRQEAARQQEQDDDARRERRRREKGKGKAHGGRHEKQNPDNGGDRRDCGEGERRRR